MCNGIGMVLQINISTINDDYDVVFGSIKHYTFLGLKKYHQKEVIKLYLYDEGKTTL